MRHILLLLVLSLGAMFPLRADEMPKAAEVAAGLKAHDRAVFLKAGWIRDPYILLASDGRYYLTGTTPLPDDPQEKQDPFNTGLGKGSIVGWKVQVWRSGDLVTWEYLGVPFTLKDGIWFAKQPQRFNSTPESQWKLWAPELHEIDGRWAIVHTSPAPVRAANLALTRDLNLRGPFDQPMGEKIAQRHDPSLFKDDDGSWWLIWGATQIARLKKDMSDIDGETVTIGPTGETAKMGHEGCLIRKIGSTYVLFGTGWSTGEMRKGSYNLYYATADKITGPYSQRKFAGRFLGHGTPFQDKQGRWWCTAFYNANVPPLEREGIQSRDLRETAQTINRQGVTVVPLEVRAEGGEVVVRAKDPAYAAPGPDEKQKF